MNPYLNPSMQIVQVSGENGARAFQMPPNSSTLLLDNTDSIVWLVQTDGAGYKTVTPYTITPYIPEPPIDVKSLEERIAALEVTIKEALGKYEQPDIVTAEPDKKSNVWKSSEHKTDDRYY